MLFRVLFYITFATPPKEPLFPPQFERLTHPLLGTCLTHARGSMSGTVVSVSWEEAT